MRTAMRISARNQIKGTVTVIVKASDMMIGVD
jgi:molybdopterin-binding protein